MTSNPPGKKRKKAIAAFVLPELIHSLRATRLGGFTIVLAASS